MHLYASLDGHIVSSYYAFSMTPGRCFNPLLVLHSLPVRCVALVHLSVLLMVVLGYRRLGCVVYSLAVGVKMNAFLWAPGIFVFLLGPGGLTWQRAFSTLCFVAVWCGIPQVEAVVSVVTKYAVIFRFSSASPSSPLIPFLICTSPSSSPEFFSTSGLSTSSFCQKISSCLVNSASCCSSRQSCCGLGSLTGDGFQLGCCKILF